MTTISTAGAILTLGLALSFGAEAQTIVSAEAPEELASIIRDLGFQAKLEKDNVGDPVIRSSSGGVDFRIYFYDCKSNKRCKSLHFSVGYDLVDGSTLDAVQQWNADKRFASAYLDDENDPFLQMDLNTEGGITQENFEKSIDLWQSLKGEFEDHIDFHAKPQRMTSAPSRETGA
jgi:Putative bacterial sensory transduction regulator